MAQATAHAHTDTTAAYTQTQIHTYLDRYMCGRAHTHFSHGISYLFPGQQQPPPPALLPSRAPASCFLALLMPFALRQSLLSPPLLAGREVEWHGGGRGECSQFSLKQHGHPIFKLQTLSTVTRKLFSPDFPNDFILLLHCNFRVLSLGSHEQLWNLFLQSHILSSN